MDPPKKPDPTRIRPAQPGCCTNNKDPIYKTHVEADHLGQIVVPLQQTRVGLRANRARPGKGKGGGGSERTPGGLRGSKRRRLSEGAGACDLLQPPFVRRAA